MSHYASTAKLQSSALGKAANRSLGARASGARSGVRAMLQQTRPGECPPTLLSGAAGVLGIFSFKTGIWSNDGVAYGPEAAGGTACWPSSAASDSRGTSKSSCGSRSKETTAGVSSDVTPVLSSSSSGINTAETLPAAPLLLPASTIIAKPATMPATATTQPATKPAAAVSGLGPVCFPVERGTLRSTAPPSSLPTPSLAIAGSSASAAASASSIMRVRAYHDNTPAHVAGGHGKVGFCRLTTTITTTATTSTVDSSDPHNAPSTSYTSRTTQRAAWKAVEFHSRLGCDELDAFAAEVVAHITVTNLGCAHVCSCYGYRQAGDSTGVLYMEPGIKDLYDIWHSFTSRRTPLPEAAIKVVLASILRALKATHEAGYAHLDLKPENVILGPDGLLKMIDFGLARPITSTATATIFTSAATAASATTASILIRPAGTLMEVIAAGTIGYAAPEVVARVPYKDNTAAWLEVPISGPAADVYSLGAVAFQLAIQPETLKALGRSTPPPASSKECLALLGHLSPELGSLIAAMVTTDPASRPAVAAALAHPALRDCESKEGRRWRW